MKLFLNSALFLALAAASAVPKQRVNYDGYKVLRVAYNDEVESLIQKNNIATWIKESGNIDVVIPPGVTALDHLDAKVMHEDLGVAVAENLAFAPAAGT